MVVACSDLNQGLGTASAYATKLSLLDSRFASSLFLEFGLIFIFTVIEACELVLFLGTFFCFSFCGASWWLTWWCWYWVVVVLVVVVGVGFHDEARGGRCWFLVTINGGFCGGGAGFWWWFCFLWVFMSLLLMGFSNT